MRYLLRTELIEYIEGYLGHRLTSPETIADEALRDISEALQQASSEDAHEELVDEILELQARVVELENALEKYERLGVNAPGGEAQG